MISLILVSWNDPLYASMKLILQHRIPFGVYKLCSDKTGNDVKLEPTWASLHFPNSNVMLICCIIKIKIYHGSRVNLIEWQILGAFKIWRGFFVLNPNIGPLQTQRGRKFDQKVVIGPNCCRGVGSIYIFTLSIRSTEGLYGIENQKHPHTLCITCRHRTKTPTSLRSLNGGAIML